MSWLIVATHHKKLCRYGIVQFVHRQQIQLRNTSRNYSIASCCNRKILIIAEFSNPSRSLPLLRLLILSQNSKSLEIIWSFSGRKENLNIKGKPLKMIISNIALSENAPDNWPYKSIPCSEYINLVPVPTTLFARSNKYLAT